MFVGFLIHRFLYRLDLDDANEAYPWMVNFLGTMQDEIIVLESQSVGTIEKGNRFSGRNSVRAEHIFTKTLPELKFIPADGWHWFSYKGKWIFMHHTHSTSMQGGGPGGSSQTTRKFLSIYLLDWDRTKLHALVHDSMTQSLSKVKEKTVVFVPKSNVWLGWEQAIVRSKRSFDSVVLASNLSEDILEDAVKFLRSADWYNSLGVPYRRSYLLHGSPGTGKTSFVVALAGKLDLNVCLLNLSMENMNDSNVAHLLRSAPLSSLILMEDVDAAFPKREEGNETDAAGGLRNRVTFSGVLNAIDGIAAQEGRLFIMTTNHPEKLDPALRRPGRVDRIVPFNRANAEQAEQLFLRFFPSEFDLAKQFVGALPENKLSMARLQGLFMRYQDSPLSTISQLPIVIAEQEAEDTRTIADTTKVVSPTNPKREKQSKKE